MLSPSTARVFPSCVSTGRTAAPGSRCIERILRSQGSGGTVKQKALPLRTCLLWEVVRVVFSGVNSGKEKTKYLSSSHPSMPTAGFLYDVSRLKIIFCELLKLN